MVAKRRLSFTPRRAKRSKRTRRANKATRALRMVRALQRQVEVKLHEITGTSVAVSDTPAFSCINQIAVGDTHGLRDGRRINMRSLSARLRLEQADTPHNYIRIVVLTMPVGQDTAPNWSEVFDNTAPGDLDFINPLRQAAFKSKYRVHYNRLFKLKTSDVGGAAVNAVRHLKFYIPLKNMPVQYSGSVADDDVVEKNQLWIGFVSDSSAISHPTYSMHALLRFTDA